MKRVMDRILLIEDDRTIHKPLKETIPNRGLTSTGTLLSPRFGMVSKMSDKALLSFTLASCRILSTRSRFASGYADHLPPPPSQVA